MIFTSLKTPPHIYSNLLSQVESNNDLSNYSKYLLSMIMKQINNLTSHSLTQKIDLQFIYGGYDVRIY